MTRSGAPSPARPLLLLAAAALASACATAPPAPAPPPSDLVILLPDRDGGAGAVEVTAGGRTRALLEPWHALRVPAGGTPGEPEPVTAERVRALAGETMEAMPDPPLRLVLYFDSGTTVLTRASREALAAALRGIRERGPSDISVVGHADTVGNKTVNDRLSLARARAVAELLAAEGIDLSSVEIVSHGKENPLVPTADQVAEPRNRRVEVTVR